MSRLAVRLLIFVLAVSATLSAQEFRATVLGLVMDSTGAVVPNASLSILNTETGVTSTATTTAEGAYVVPFLLPGRYTVRVEASGFKTTTRTPVDLRVNDRTRVDFNLEVGNVAENVTVTATTPLLEVATSNRGQVVENRAVTDLPFNAHNPLTLIGIATGVQYTGSGQYFRSFDNGAINAFSINGGRSGINEYQLDGIPNNAILVNQSPNICSGYTPPLEAIREFKIMTTTYDAQYGRTGGGIVTMEVKSGANVFHGVGSYFMRRPWIEANTFTNNASGAPKAQRKVDHLNAEIDGPVNIPGLYKGKDRTFFTFAFEFYKEKLPQPLQGSVPTALQRAGDFSKTYTASGALFTIYDPLTVQANPAFDPTKPVTLSNLQYRRTPFAGNVVPGSRQNAIAKRILQDIPAGNQAGDSPSGLNNWFADAFTLNNYPSYVARVDHNFSEKVRGYFRWHHAFRDGTQTDYWAWGTPATRSLYGNYKENGAVVDVVASLSPTTVLDFRLGFGRVLMNSRYSPVDLTGLGFPASLVGQLQLADLYPMITFDNYMQVGNTLWDLSPSETYSGQATMLKVIRGHSLKMGAEYRLMRLGDAVRTYGSGLYSFGNSWTSSNPQVTDATGGNSIASFLLGTMASGSAYINAAPYLTWKYPALFLQDDWQVNRKLTLNLGLRWDHEGPPVDRFNRQTRGFDYTAAFPIQAPGYSLKGGLLYTGANGQPRGAFNSDLRDWQPRAGMAYRMFSQHPLVFRAGFGRYFLPTSEYGGTTGFTQITSAQTSTAAYLPFSTFNNPFPSGLTQPTGSSQGLATGAGTAISFSDPTRIIPAVWQFSAGFQYEVKAGLLAELSYVGSRTSRVQVNQSINYLSREQLAQGTAYLSQSVSNPFYGLLPANTSLGAQSTTQRRSLMTPYPQFSGVTANYRSLGESWYNSLQVKLERRLHNGLSFLASYTFSKTMQATAFLNAQDTSRARQLTTFDVPHRLVITGLYELPFGPRKALAGNGLISHIIGNWQFSWNMVIQSGTPMPIPGGYYIQGDPRLASGQSMSRWFNTSKDIWVTQPPDTLRTSPLVASTIRSYAAPQLNANLMREFRIGERHRLQLKASAYNATNTPTFGFPNTTPTSPLFGVVPTTQANLPRSTELGIRYAF
jgi:hypothetical protein